MKIIKTIAFILLIKVTGGRHATHILNNPYRMNSKKMFLFMKPEQTTIAYMRISLCPSQLHHFPCFSPVLPLPRLAFVFTLLIPMIRPGFKQIKLRKHNRVIFSSTNLIGLFFRSQWRTIAIFLLGKMSEIFPLAYNEL